MIRSMLSPTPILGQAVVTTEGFSYSEFLSITLTALAIILAALGILIGILALWGYQAIKTEARKAASKAVEDAIQKMISSEQIRDHIKGVVLARTQEEGDKLFVDLKLTGAAGKLTEPYPKKNPERE